MATRRRSGRKVRRRGARGMIAALFVLALVFALLLYAQSRILHVRYATIRAADLPQGFDGTTVLFASDIDIKGASDARAAAKLFDRLRALKPDMLLLGGDYAGLTLLETINGADPNDAAVADRMAADRRIFIQSLADFPAPLGKYAVLSDSDVLPDELAAAMRAAGVRLLRDDIAYIERGGARVALAGLSASPDDAARVGRGISSAEFAVAFAHSPAQFVRVLTTDAADGGAWADLLLAGGTHGGQMRVADRTLLTLTEHERRYLSGWRKEGNSFLLTSRGVGCEAVNLRLNAEAEVHLITLRRADNAYNE